MLERATACLKSGAAARDSLKCVRHAPKSSRLLHSTFWNHGAGDLDLPPWTLPTLPYTNSKPSRGQRRSLKSVETDLMRNSSVGPEGLFLDFLYPPQALAWFQRVNAQQYQRWERRNARRLPEGFIVASREYSSRSQSNDLSGETQKAQDRLNVVEFKMHEERLRQTESPDNSLRQPLSPIDPSRAAEGKLAVFSPLRPLGQDVRPKQHAASLQTIESEISSFELPERDAETERRAADVSSPITWSDSSDERTGQVSVSTLEQESEPGMKEDKEVVKDLYKTIRLNKTASTGRPDEIVNTIKHMYYSLDKASRNDVKLNQAVLEFLASFLPKDRRVWKMSHQLYQSIPLGERTLETYQAFLTVLIHSPRYPKRIMERTHREALQKIENGHQVSRILFRHALERSRWPIAIDIAMQFHEHFANDYQASQIRVFWLHISETPRLLEKAITFNNWFRKDEWYTGDWSHKPNGDELNKDEKLGRIVATLYREAIAQEFLRMEGQTSFEDSPPFHRLPTNQMRAVLARIPRVYHDGAKLFSAILWSILQYRNGPRYAQLHCLASTLYEQYSTTPGVTPPEPLFMVWLERLTEVEDGPAAPRTTARSMDIEKLVGEWERYYTHVSKEGVQRLMVFYARLGEIKSFDKWLEYLRSHFPKYEDQRNVLWTMVYVQAKRADLDCSQQAFAEIRRIGNEHGDQPDLKSWNVLLTAHMRADDLEGALTNLQHLIDTRKLTPDGHTIHPVLQLLASRGDVEGVVNVLSQYRKLFDGQLTTPLLSSLLLAHVNNDDIPTAETKLGQSIPLVKRGTISGSLTSCFNVILLGHALRRDLAATLRTQRWMNDAKVRLDGNSYAAVMQSLVMRRRPYEARRVMEDYMLPSGVVPTSFHYAIIIAGFVNVGESALAMDIYEKMVRRRYKPTVSTNIAYLKAKANEERTAIRTMVNNQNAIPLEETIATLKEFLYNDAGMAAHPTQSTLGLSLPVSDTGTLVPAAYISFLIDLHGRQRCFEAVQELHQQYLKEAEKRAASQDAIPLTILAALARAHYTAREHDQVDSCWLLAKGVAERIAPLVPIPTFKLRRSNTVDASKVSELRPASAEAENEAAAEHSGEYNDEEDASNELAALLQSPETPDGAEADTRTLQLAPARRHILTHVFRFWLRSKQARNEPLDVINTVTQLLDQGYTLDQITWNTLIRTLVRRAVPLTLLAFVLTERYLTPNFPGWEVKAHCGWPPNRPAARSRLQRIQAHFIAPGVVMPRYDTIVALAHALLALRRSEALGFSDIAGGVPAELKDYVGDVSKIEALAPHTVEILKSMPRVHDRLQEEAFAGFGIL